MSHHGPGLADIIRQAGAGFRERFAGALDGVALKVLDCIERCRTPALGGTVYLCTDCGHVHGVWRSCGNRQCPACQGAAAHRWMEKQTACILPVPYFHVVFTLPPPIARIAMQNRTVVFSILFRTATETLRTISADPGRSGISIGGTAVLHTWNQKLQWHPHLHCVVPNGGFDVDTGQWTVGSDRFFAPVKVLASFFRRRMLEELAAAHARQELVFHGSIARLADPRSFARHLKQARAPTWNVYAKAPFNGPAAVIRYLSRYTHRIAISDARIVDFDGEAVTFRHRKPVARSTDKPRYATMSLPVDVFLRRYLMHCLPTGFHRIRHFGILANGCRARTLAAVPRIDDGAVQANDGADGDDGANIEDSRPVCPACGKLSEPVLTIDRRDGHTPQDLAELIRSAARQRGPPRAHGST